MNEETKKLLKVITDLDENFDGAVNIREDCQSVFRKSTKNIEIKPKTDAPGLEIYIAANTDGEKVYIPACVTKSNVDDLVYNDFYVGENANVTIIAGCGVHSQSGELARHSGIHRFYLEKNSSVLYLEKHIGTGVDKANRQINPTTEAFLGENAMLEMDTSQIGGISNTDRKTKAVLDKKAKLVIKERLLTDNDEIAKTHFTVEVNGDDASVNLVSRSVARGDSYQEYYSNIIGNAKCQGHSECDGILAENGRVNANPSLLANNRDAALIHEAAIGKIAGEQILKLKTLGLTEKEAEATIINGFLK